MESKPKKENKVKILTLRSEKEFFDLIQERMKDQGFEILETSIRISERKRYRNIYT